MSHIGYESIMSGRTNKYETTFFHIYLECESPITHTGLKEIDKRDLASFIHEYVHYIQQITTPYGLNYSGFFIYRLFLFREFIDDHQTISPPIPLDDDIQSVKEFESELSDKNGSKFFLEGNIGAIDIALSDIEQARTSNKAVNIGVYDFENQRVFEKGFQFGYTCVMEGMAHLVQSLVNPDLYHSDIPYKAVQLICDEIRPDLKNNIKLLIAICYTALFFDNPGPAFIEILSSASSRENGIELFQRYMRGYSRTFRGKVMLNYEMMHILMDEFTAHWEALIGNELIFMKKMMENCKYESTSGDSVLLNLIYLEDLSTNATLDKLLDFYGYPAIDSKNSELVYPRDRETNQPYTETGALLSLELLYARLRELGNQQKCIRLPICDRITRENNKALIDEHCAGTQWEKKLPCLFTGGLNYWRMSNKSFE
jgi:hypothetical protein